MNGIEILKSPSEGPKNNVNMWIRLMSIDFSYTATCKERERYENNLTLGVNGQGPRPGPMKNRGDFQQTVRQLVALKPQAEKPNPCIPKHMRFRQRPREERAQ